MENATNSMILLETLGRGNCARNEQRFRWTPIYGAFTFAAVVDVPQPDKEIKMKTNTKRMTINTTTHAASIQALIDVGAKRIPMYVDSCYVEGHAPHIPLKSDTTLRLPNGKRFGVGAIPVGGKGRKISYGPEVEGPWAFAYGLATCLSGDASVRDRMAAERDADVLIDEGTVLKIDAKLYTVTIVRREFVELIAAE